MDTTNGRRDAGKGVKEEEEEKEGVWVFYI